MHPNWVAYAALVCFPALALYVYARFPVSQATVWTIFAGFLLLPVGALIKVAEGIPQLDKTSIPSLAALCGCVLVAGRRIRFWNGFGIPEGLLLVFLLSPFVTSLLNTDTTASGGRLLPPVGAYDGLSAASAQVLFVLPFFLGRALLRSSADVELLLRTLAVAGLLYSLPMLFEIRMSSQLHNWVYGYYPSDFIQQMREGGFRPTVFIGHGLAVAFFTMTAIVAAAGLWRARIKLLKLPSSGATAYLSIVLFLCKSLGPMLYGAFGVAIVRWTKPRLQLRVAVVFAVVALAYPLLRAEDLVPTRYILEAAASLSKERAQSLETRFDQEEQLLHRASQRFFFGWGDFGRSCVYNEWGGDISVTDGHWIITMGQFGLVGFLAEFGLLALPVIRSASKLRFVEFERDRLLLGVLALILAINTIDLLPNALLDPVTWLFAGALLGRSEALRSATGRLRPLERQAIAKQTIESSVVR